MIVTFQESSCGATEMAKPVGHSQMSSISSLIADSSSSRVFAGFFKRAVLSARAHPKEGAQPRLGGFWGLWGAEPRRPRNVRSPSNQLLLGTAVPTIEPSFEKVWLVDAVGEARAAARSF